MSSDLYFDIYSEEIKNDESNKKICFKHILNISNIVSLEWADEASADLSLIIGLNNKKIDNDFISSIINIYERYKRYYFSSLDSYYLKKFLLENKDHYFYSRLD